MRLWSILCLASVASALWPIPRVYQHGDRVVWLMPDVEVRFNGEKIHKATNEGTLQTWLALQIRQHVIPRINATLGGFGPVSDSELLTSKEIVSSGVQRTLHGIFSEKYVPWKLHARHSDFEPSPKIQAIISVIDIRQTQSGEGDSSAFLAGKVDESYTLNVKEDGEAFIEAKTAFGVLHALTTFGQLFFSHSAVEKGVYTNIAPAKITDSPRFAHRGLNLDVARTWYPVADILRTIDALSWSKFNRLHLHATDGQSWPLDIPALPELTKKGSYRRGLYYSEQDLERIQKYGISRGVQVFIEIDVPGHTSVVGLSYPELIAAHNMQPDWDNYAAEPPSGQLKLNSSAVRDFMKTLYGDLLPRAKKSSTLFHTGGDEVNANAYKLDETVRSGDKKVIRPHLQAFLDSNHDSVRQNGMTPVVWEEMLLEWDLDLKKDVIIQTWRSDQALKTVVSKGFRALAGNYNYWYLDCGKGQWLGFRDASFQKYYPFADYCSPTKNWRLVYSYDPVGGLSEEEAKLVLGGEVHLWSEQTDPVNMDDMLWPRACAAAEVLWSGRQDSAGRNRSQIEAGPRLAEMRERLVQRGIRAGPSQMIFCTQNGPEACAL